jgi:hypothetical protein
LFPRDFQIDVLEIVLARAANMNRAVALSAKSWSCSAARANSALSS